MFIGGAIALSMLGSGVMHLLSYEQQREQADIQAKLYQAQADAAEANEASRSIQRMDKLDDTLSAQAVASVARGMDVSSGSFKAIQRKSYDAFREDEEGDRFNTTMQVLGYKTQAAQQEQEKSYSAIQNLSEFGEHLANLGVFAATGASSGATASAASGIDLTVPQMPQNQIVPDWMRER